VSGLIKYLLFSVVNDAPFLAQMPVCAYPGQKINFSIKFIIKLINKHPVKTPIFLIIP
jgi:hypothetical protein